MSTFDIAFEEMQNNGFTERVLKKYEPIKGMWYKPKEPQEDL